MSQAEWADRRVAVGSLAPPCGVPDHRLPPPVSTPRSSVEETPSHLAPEPTDEFEPEQSWRASIALILLATAILVAGFVLVLVADGKPEVAGPTTTASATTASAATTVGQSATTAPVAATTAGQPATTAPAAATTVAATPTANTPGAGVVGRLAFVEATSSDGVVCASGPAAIVHARALLLTPVTAPATCTNADFVVKIPVGGSPTILDVPYRATLVAVDAATGLGVLRVDRDITGRWLPAPPVEVADVSAIVEPDQVSVHTLAVSDGLVEVGPGEAATVAGGTISDSSPRPLGAVLTDPDGRVVGFLRAGDSTRVAWSATVATLIKGATAAVG